MTPRITLTVREGGLAGKTFEFAGRRQFLIGRGSDCDLRLSDDFEFMSVSRHHCLIDVDPPAVRVRDLGSRNGTRLDGAEIGRPQQVPPDAGRARVCREYRLLDGDELTLGPLVFEVGIDMLPERDAKEDNEPLAEAELGACI
jgi:eukaryotic-like serine/threonine-protein kinase